MVPMPGLLDAPKAPPVVLPNALPPPPPKSEVPVEPVVPDPKPVAGFVPPKREEPLPNPAEVALLVLLELAPKPPKVEGPAVEVVELPNRPPALVVAPPKAGFAPKALLVVEPKPPEIMK